MISVIIAVLYIFFLYILVISLEYKFYILFKITLDISYSLNEERVGDIPQNYIYFLLIY